MFNYNVLSIRLVFFFILFLQFKLKLIYTHRLELFLIPIQIICLNIFNMYILNYGVLFKVMKITIIFDYIHS